MADATETAGLERHEIVISADDTTSHDTASWYSLTIVLKDCIDFVHDAIESLVPESFFGCRRWRLAYPGCKWGGAFEARSSMFITARSLPASSAAIN